MGITVSNLTKEYGPQKAVDDISFEVKTGEILGFLGPNGAGKSTTMKIISCFVSPTSGNVELDGYNIHDHSREVRQQIGYLPENNPLYKEMSIVDYLDFTANLQDMPQAHIYPKIREMIDVCGLGPERHKNIGELSKGFQQRVGLAQALIHDPSVLILDEPTEGLDPNQIVEIRQLIRNIGQEKTVMLSSHILKEVEATCDRILIINDGRLVADGSTEELRQRAEQKARLRVQIKSNGDGNPGDSIQELESVTGVDQDQGADDTMWLLEVTSPDQAAEEVFNMCVEHNWVLTQLTPIETSLEDVFRSVTTTNE